MFLLFLTIKVKLNIAKVLQLHKETEFYLPMFKILQQTALKTSKNSILFKRGTCSLKPFLILLCFKINFNLTTFAQLLGNITLALSPDIDLCIHVV